MVPDGLLRDLASRSPAELAELLAARPDAVRSATTTADLAEALLSRTGLRRALDQLSRPELDALERAAVLGVPEGSAGPWPAVPPWDRLHRLALVHRDGDALRLVPGVVEALGRHPAGLGRPRAVLADLAARLRGGEPVTVAAPPTAEEIASWPAPVRDVLDRFRTVPVGRLPDALRRPDAAADAAAGPVDWLLAQGVLLPVDPRHVELPREVGLALHSGDPWSAAPPEPPRPTPRDVPDRLRDNAAAAAVEQQLRRLAALRAELRDRPLTTLRAGGIGVRELRRLRSSLGTDQPELVRLLGLGELSGLVHLDPDTSTWRPAPARFEDVDRADQWTHVARSWLASDVVPSAVGLPLADGSVVRALTRGAHAPEAPAVRRALLEALAELPSGGHDAGEVVAYAGGRRPRLAGPLRRWGPGMLTEAAEVGLLGAGALTAPGRALAAGRTGDAGRSVAAWLPVPSSTVLLQSDLTATATGHLEPAVARALAQLADEEGHGPAPRHRFTERSLHRALDAGWTPATVLAWLREHGAGPVPQPLAYLVEEAGRGHGRIRITRAEWVLTGEEELLAALAGSPGLAGRPLRRPAPGVLVVGTDPHPRAAGRAADPGPLVSAVRATGTEPALDLVRPQPDRGEAGVDPLLLLEVPAPQHPAPTAEEVQDALARLARERGDETTDPAGGDPWDH
ncbi:helicase-associated domain-containing protein [Kocuria sp. M1R5S2]|uniref:helicase-associated domain-containing protein n=1 Tax=Kocuria rhizosphaerae TaxID=3376285 RepID=UPI0037A1388E